MKKLSLFLALLMMLSSFAFFTVSAEDAAASAVFKFEFETLPFDKGKNGQCYFPNPDRKSDTDFPEIYTWNSCSLVMDGDFMRADIKTGSMLEFDSMPSKYKITKDLPYLLLVVKADKEQKGAPIAFVSQGNTYKRSYKADFTGGWQKIVIDLTGTEGWTKKGESGQYEAFDGAAWTDGKYGDGGFRIDLPGGNITTMHFDAIGFFPTADDAAKYEARAKDAAVSNVKYEGTGTSTGGSTGGTTGGTTGGSTGGTTTPATPEEDKWEPSIFNATKKEEKPQFVGEFKSVAPYGVTEEEGKVVFKFENITSPEKGKFETGIAKNKIINTYGQIQKISMEGGLLKVELDPGNLFEMTNCALGITVGKYPYWIIGYKTSANVGNTASAYIYSSGNAFRTKVSFKGDGEWHYDVMNMSNPSVIERNDENGKYYGIAADEDIAKIGYGALRIDFAKFGSGTTYYIDYLAFFADEESAKAYAEESVKNLANNLPEDKGEEEETAFSYIKGYRDGTFKPNNKMTRAEAITVIARLVGNDEMIAEKRETKFTDIKEGDWYYNAITFLEANGLLPNYSGTIEPNKNITRGEFVKLAYEAKAFEFKNSRTKFSDLDSKHPYYKEIILANANGAIKGYSDGTIKPDGEITRAEIVTIINRILGIEDSTADPTFSDISDHWAKGAVMAAVGK